MASTSETGHAKNVANFQDLIAVCTGLGIVYNPAKASIQLGALSTKYNTADQSIKTLNQASPVLTNAVNEREKLFAPLRQLAARLNSAVASSDAPANALADVKTFTRKLQGQRAIPKIDTPPANPDNPIEVLPKNISVSQLSYDSQVENLSKLTELLTAIPGYAPNESELSVVGLQALLTGLKNANTNAINAQVQVANARAARNTQLYHSETGLVKTAADVKSYIKSVFTIKSPQYKQVSNLQFSKPRGI
jgi:hypothetical protein